jgi:two-component system sensor histidine kinase UhpB
MLEGLRWIVAVSALLGMQAAAAFQVFHRAEVATVPAASMQWHAVDLPHEWESTFPGYSGVAEYRLQFEAPVGQELLGVYVQRACTNLEVFVNGELIGSGGRMAPPVARNCYYPQLMPLPRSLLRPGKNELRIRVAGFAAREVSARQRAAGLSAVQVGALGELQPLYESQRFWNITAAQIIATSIGALGLAMLGLAAVRRRDTYLLYFGLFTTGWALISTRLFVQHVPLSNLHTEILICSAFPPVLGCAYLFLMRLVERRYRWVDAALLAQALVVPVVLVAAAPEHLLRAATVVYNLVALEFIACVVWFFPVAWRGFRRDFWLLGVVLLVAVGLAGAEIALQNDLLPLPKVHLIHFAMPLIFAVLGLRLIQLFVKALTRAETLNLELEQRVAEKSAELESNWRQIARLRTAEAAENERRRIASDLHDDLGAQLLTIAQASQRGHDTERVAGMARQAMEEMRLSVRGLTGDAADAQNVLADWRAETVTRLTDAGFEPRWEAGEPPPGLVLPSRTHVQLTRILREAVSNAIRHSGGRRCAVRIGFEDGGVQLAVEDDGRGLAPARPRTTGGGHGLPNIERRVRNLGGEHRFEQPAGGGARLVVRVPLPAQSANIEPL